MIGLGSVMALLGSGKIPGISGVAGRILLNVRGDRWWRVIFIVSIIAGAALAFQGGFGWQQYSVPPGRSLLIYAAAGLFVGFGARMGGGCTSGHGVCGIGAGAKDALIYTIVFMISSMFTVAVWNKLIGLS